MWLDISIEESKIDAPEETFLQLFRIIKLLLWKVLLLPRHARQKQVSRSIFLQFLVKISTFQQLAPSPQMCLSPVFCRSVYRPVCKIPATSASMAISGTNARCFAGTFPGQFTKYRRVIGWQHWLMIGWLWNKRYLVLSVSVSHNKIQCAVRS